jgi:hypothetical protein
MFLNKNTFLATIKEKEGKVEVDGRISYTTYPVTLLNSKDIRVVEESSKKNFKNINVDDLIAEPILVFKSFDKNRVYICSWHYDDLKKKIQKAQNGQSESALNTILEDLAITYDGKIDPNNKKLLDDFAYYLKKEMLAEINDADRRV